MLSHRGTPSYHSFLFGIVHYKPSSYWVPHLVLLGIWFIAPAYTHFCSSWYIYIYTYLYIHALFFSSYLSSYAPLYPKKYGRNYISWWHILFSWLNSKLYSMKWLIPYSINMPSLWLDHTGSPLVSSFPLISHQSIKSDYWVYVPVVPIYIPSIISPLWLVRCSYSSSCVWYVSLSYIIIIITMLGLYVRYKLLY